MNDASAKGTREEVRMAGVGIKDNCKNQETGKWMRQRPTVCEAFHHGLIFPVNTPCPPSAPNDQEKSKAGFSAWREGRCSNVWGVGRPCELLLCLKGGVFWLGAKLAEIRWAL